MMSKYKVLFKSSAANELKKIDKHNLKKILNKIELLSQNPIPSGVKKLKGEPYFRIRIGHYRVIYEINYTNNEVIIYRIRHRKDAYKGL